MRDSKPIKQPTISEQLVSWKYDSHHWVDKPNGVCQCEWCGFISPNTLVDIDICEENPEIKKMLNGKVNEGIVYSQEVYEKYLNQIL